MNFTLKTKTYNIVTGGQALATLESILGPKARLIGISATNVGATGVDTAIWLLVMNTGGIDFPLANGKVNTANTTLEWWTGIDGRWKEGVANLTASNDIAVGFIPKAMPVFWTDDAGGRYDLKFSVTLAGVLSACTIWYTNDIPKDPGEDL